MLFSIGCIGKINMHVASPITIFPCRGYSQAGINDKEEPESYPLWIVSISGPFLFISAVIHAALWKPWDSAFGAIVSYYSS